MAWSLVQVLIHRVEVDLSLGLKNDNNLLPALESINNDEMKTRVVDWVFGKFQFANNCKWKFILSADTKMLSKSFAVTIAVVLALVFLAEAREEGPHDMADALRMLQELDRYYTQAARPR